MNQTALLSIAVAAGFAGGFLGSILTAPAVDSDPAGVPGDGNPALEASLGSLETRMQTIEASTDALELSVGVLDGRYEDLAAVIPASQPGGTVSDNGGVPSLAAADLPTGAGFDAAVNAAIDQREAEETAQRDVARQERRDEQMQRRVDDLAEQLNLDPGQKTQFADVLKETSTKRDAMFADMREAGNWDRDAIRELTTTLRDEETAAMADFLNDDQMTTYKEVGTTSAFGGFGGRGGQRGGGGTGGTGGGGRGGF